MHLQFWNYFAHFAVVTVVKFRTPAKSVTLAMQNWFHCWPLHTEHSKQKYWICSTISCFKCGFVSIIFIWNDRKQWLFKFLCLPNLSGNDFFRPPSKLKNVPIFKIMWRKSREFVHTKILSLNMFMNLWWMLIISITHSWQIFKSLFYKIFSCRWIGQELHSELCLSPPSMAMSTHCPTTLQ